MNRAMLIELDQSFEKEKDGGQKVEVQFNPETLKVTFANEIKQPDGGDQGANTSGRQFVGAGTTKLALQLWFDVTAMEKNAVDDVRRLTQKVVFFMTPQKSDDPNNKDPNMLAPPGVRFAWGSFIFDGMVEALEESLEYFSADGKPLRASITMTLSQQKILERKVVDTAAFQVRPGHKPPGHAPMKQARDGDSLQGMAGNKKGGSGSGSGSGWQGIAAANDIEDPLRMTPGRLIDLNASVSFGASAGFGASASTSAGLGASASISAGSRVSGGLNASLGAASASLSIG